MRIILAEEIKKDQKPDERPELRPKRKRGWRVFKITFLILVILFSVLMYKAISMGEGTTDIWTQIKHLITSKDKEVAGEQEDRINILLLGVGGEGHEGPNLSDTIILASFKPSTRQVALLSIPRDLYAPIPNIGYRKINYAYAIGEAQKSGSGGPLASTVVSNVFDVPIHYYVRLDFSGFDEIIDSLGGVTVNVENVIDDEFYPIPGKETATTSERYEHFYLEQGIKFMNGETALRYVRSRKAKGVEGSDFARSKRQQKVLMAIKEKVSASNLLLNPGKISNVIKTLNRHLDTNLEIWEILRLYSLGKAISLSDITTYVLADEPETGLLVAATAADAFVLKPRTGDFFELQKLEKNIFNSEYENAFKPKTEELPEGQAAGTEPSVIIKGKYNLQIHNGTTINGLAGEASKYLSGEGYQISSVGNAPIQSYKKTLIYALKPQDISKNVLDDLEKKLEAIVFTSGPPMDLTDSAGKITPYPIDKEADVLIILGEDADDTF